MSSKRSFWQPYNLSREDSANEVKHKNFTLFEELTDEEYEGVRKYRHNRFVYGMFGVAFLLLFSLLIFLFNQCAACNSQHAIMGTWVAVEDYEDGFDPDDRYLEFTADNVFYMNGSKTSTYTNDFGKYVIESPSMMSNYPYTAEIINRTLHLKYYENRSCLDVLGLSPNYIAGWLYSSIPSDSSVSITDIYSIISSSDYSGAFLSPVPVEETFIRISKETGLTEEQRAELYK